MPAIPLINLSFSLSNNSSENLSPINVLKIRQFGSSRHTRERFLPLLRALLLAISGVFLAEVHAHGACHYIYYHVTKIAPPILSPFRSTHARRLKVKSSIFPRACLTMQGWEVIAVLLSTLCAVQCRQYTLNVPRVLLPIVPASGVKANFTLKSQAGCFTW